MYEALQACNVESRLIIYEGMMHGNSYGAKGKYYGEATAEMIGWFIRHLTKAN
jgi:dipeptidyl aminopeptidase/acylaminoacyl peptidase